MNKTEFIAAIAEEAGLSKTDAAKAVDSWGKDSNCQPCADVP